MPRRHPAIDLARTVLAVVAAAAIASCATVPPVQLAFAVGRDGPAEGRPLPCDARRAAEPAANGGEALPGATLRVLSWNIHKNGDAGWDADLARFAADADLVLLQEAWLSAPLQALLATEGFDGILASSFTLDGRATGVLSAARVPPTTGCVQRRFEPLLRLPKAAVITRYRIDGSAEELAVANVHSINFALTLDQYRLQLEAVAGELAGHRGPVIVAGDFNTWNPTRLKAVDEVMRRIDLAPVLLATDARTRFLGHQVDHLYVRGLDVVEARAIEVRSSDHNPVVARLRLAPAR